MWHQTIFLAETNVKKVKSAIVDTYAIFQSRDFFKKIHLSKKTAQIVEIMELVIPKYAGNRSKGPPLGKDIPQPLRQPQPPPLPHPSRIRGLKSPSLIGLI